MKTNRNKVRLTENQLHSVIKESINKVLKEANHGADGATTYYGSNEDFMKDFYNKRIDNFIKNDSAWQDVRHRGEKEGDYLYDKNSRYNMWDGDIKHGAPKFAKLIQTLDKCNSEIFNVIDDMLEYMHLTEEERDFVVEVSSVIKKLYERSKGFAQGYRL